jgi:hypothetical protein
MSLDMDFVCYKGDKVSTEKSGCVDSARKLITRLVSVIIVQLDQYWFFALYTLK